MKRTLAIECELMRLQMNNLHNAQQTQKQQHTHTRIHIICIKWWKCNSITCRNGKIGETKVRTGRVHSRIYFIIYGNFGRCAHKKMHIPYYYYYHLHFALPKSSIHDLSPVISLSALNCKKNENNMRWMHKTKAFSRIPQERKCEIDKFQIVKRMEKKNSVLNLLCSVNAFVSSFGWFF